MLDCPHEHLVRLCIQQQLIFPPQLEDGPARLMTFMNHQVCELRKHFSFLFSPFFEDFSAAQPFLLQQVNNQLVHDFLSQQNNRLFLFFPELMDLFVAGRDQSAADQPNYLAEGHPPL